MKYSNLDQVKAMVNNLATNQEKENIHIDQFAKSVINKVFKELALIFPAWKNCWNGVQELEGAKLQWIKAFVENNISTMDQISCGFAKARRADSDFIPSCGKFISWCKPSAEDMGYPSEQQALKRCISHRNAEKLKIPSNETGLIIELCKRVDWWQMNSAVFSADIKKANEHFKQEYEKLISEGYVEPVQNNDMRLETKDIVTERMSTQQKEDGRKRGLEVLNEIKKKLKGK